jgi:hypothetical protein
MGNAKSKEKVIEKSKENRPSSSPSTLWGRACVTDYYNLLVHHPPRISSFTVSSCCLRGAYRQSLVGQREVGLGAAHHVVARLLPHGAAAVARGCRPGGGGCSGRAVGGGDDLDAFGSGSGAGDGRAGFQPGVLVVGNEPKSKYSVSN